MCYENCCPSDSTCTSGHNNRASFKRRKLLFGNAVQSRHLVSIVGGLISNNSEKLKQCNLFRSEDAFINSRKKRINVQRGAQLQKSSRRTTSGVKGGGRQLEPAGSFIKSDESRRGVTSLPSLFRNITETTEAKTRHHFNYTKLVLQPLTPLVNTV